MSNPRVVASCENISNFSLLLALPVETIVHIIMLLPKSKAQLASVAQSCHALFNITRDKKILDLFPYTFDYSNVGSTNYQATGFITASALSPSGDTLAICQHYHNTATQSGSYYYDAFKMQLINAKSGQIIHSNMRKGGIGDEYTKLVYMPSEKYLIAICQKSIDIFDLTSGELHYSIPFVFNTKIIACLSESELLILCNDWGLQKYNIINRQWTKFISGEGNDIQPSAVCVSHDNKFLYIADCKDNSLKIYDTQAKLFIKNIHLNFRVSDCLKDIFISNDNNLLFYKIETHDVVGPDAVTFRDRLKILNIKNETENFFDVPFCRFSSFKLNATTGHIILGISRFTELSNHDGFTVLDKNGKKLGYIPYLPNSHETAISRYEAHMSPKGDRMIVVNQGIRYADSLGGGNIEIYKFNQLDLKKEVQADHGSYSVNRP